MALCFQWLVTVSVTLLMLKGTSIQAQKKTVGAYFLSKELDAELELTACIALKEIALLTQHSLEDGMMILPTNSAWSRSTETCRWFKALMAEESSELRQELMLEVATTIPGDWEELYEMVSEYPFIDATSGNVYFVDVETDPDRPQLCLSVWEDGDYQATEECAEMRLPPIGNPQLLGNQYIYKVEDVVLPEAFIDKLDEAAAEYTCDLAEVPSCDQKNGMRNLYGPSPDLYGAIEHSEDYMRTAIPRSR